MKRLLFAMALACGRLNGDDTTGGGGDIPLDQLAPQLAHVECEQMFKCCDLTDREKLLGPFGSNADMDESECEFQLGSAVQFSVSLSDACQRKRTSPARPFPRQLL